MSTRFIAVPALRIIGLTLLVTAGLLSLPPAAPAQETDSSPQLEYPEARRGDVVDVYHGTEVPDPYRWLEDGDSEETMAWVEAQNELTSSFIETPQREKIRQRLESLLNYPRHSLPFKRGGRYFFWKNDGLQNHSVFYVQETLDSEPKVVIDPNLLSEDGRTAVTNVQLSYDGKLMAYGISGSGSDWSTLHVMEVDSGRDLGDELEWCHGPGVAWKQDNSGFFYDRYPDPATVPEEDRNNYNRVYWHELGTSQSEDKLVYEDPVDKEVGHHPFVTEDQQYLILHIYKGAADYNKIYYRPIENSDEFIRLIDEEDAEYSFINNIDRTFYFETNLDAPKGRVIAVDLDNPARENWEEIIPEKKDPLHFVTMANNHFVVAYLRDAQHKLEIYDLDGEFVDEITLPTAGSIAGLNARNDETEMFFGFTSFLHPTTQFLYDFETGEQTVFRDSGIEFDPEPYVTNQIFCTSKDGTEIPVFLVHRKDMLRHGRNPCILRGYGGFSVSMMPRFSSFSVVWLENGGIIAVACLRGGGEYGEEWHQAGKLEKKQNVFDDFYAAAEYLIEKRYTSPPYLAAEGGSNGGLLVAAAAVQRPELFGAILCGAPLTDMLRYHKFGPGRFWVPEYGNAEANPEHFEFLYAYSPLHNVKDGVEYPATLVTSGDQDDRVVPMHAKKFVAALQAADSGDNPILLKFWTETGHGVGTPMHLVIDEIADEFAFVMRVFKMKLSASY
jgi:prolyl oligopeptidase